MASRNIYQEIRDRISVVFGKDGFPYVPADGSIYTKDEWDKILQLRQIVTDCPGHDQLTEESSLPHMMGQIRTELKNISWPTINDIPKDTPYYSINIPRKCGKLQAVHNYLGRMVFHKAVSQFIQDKIGGSRVSPWGVHHIYDSEPKEVPDRMYPDKVHLMRDCNGMLTIVEDDIIKRDIMGQWITPEIIINPTTTGR